ncbi:tetratricopeptide repeat protein [Comamonas faecalis]|uniref:Tetratricopeptide repeat protein n=1 Tax=Comamonas faecalis TaxID=1387849 RepID=A0ABP7R9P4_9BURK
MVSLFELRLPRLTTAVALAALCMASAASAQPGHQPQTADLPPPAQAADDEDAAAELTAELFYEILLGEMTTSRGDPGHGFALILDAARRSGDARLYRRATDIALQSRSAESALIAVRAWLQAKPHSHDANRYLLRILVALNRVADTTEPLQRELNHASAADLPTLIRALPFLYARVSDKGLAAQVIEQALADRLDDPLLGPPAWVAIGRLRLAGGDLDGALSAARLAQLLNARDDATGALALQLLERGVREADPLLQRYLAGGPEPEIRMGYARLLVDGGQQAQAQQQVQTTTREHPEYTQAWLVLASLQLQQEQLEAARTSVDRLMQLLHDQPESGQRQQSLDQALLMLSRIDEKRGDYGQAERWLDQIPDGGMRLDVQARHAAILAGQGRIDAALASIDAVPAETSTEERQKLQAQAQLLRDAGRYEQAYQAISRAAALAPRDNDLAYEQAMLAEKAGHSAQMEALLGQIIERAPDYHHALNALGYLWADRGEKLPQARALIARALAQAPDDPFITDSMGWVEFRLGNHAQALELLQRAFAVQADAEIAAHLGEVQWALGQRSEALATWRKGLRLDKNNTTLRATIKRLGARP